MIDPYAPPAELETSARSGRVALLWNALILVAMLGVGALAIRSVGYYYDVVVGNDKPRSDAWSTFTLGAANTLLPTLGILLVLTSLSTMPLHRRPMLTRAIAISTCILISLDFHMLRWRIAPEYPARAMIFAVTMPTMIVFGCGVPRVLNWVLRLARKSGSVPDGG
jgi:hypothetical protein